MEHLVLAFWAFARFQDRWLSSDPISAGGTNQPVMPEDNSGDTKSASNKQEENDADPR